MAGLPTVRIDDVIIHPRDNDLILRDARPQHLDHRRHHGAAAADRRDDDDRRGPVRHPAGRRVGERHRRRPITVGGAKHFRGQNPARGSAISYWLKSEPPGEVRIAITDVTGREIRSINGTKTAGLNRVQWDLGMAGGGRGRGQGGGGQGAAAPAATAQPQPGAPGVGGQQPAQPETPAPAEQAPGQATAAQAQAGGGRGFGRGGFGGGPPVAPGTYLVKLTAGDKVLGQKTIVVEADSTFPAIANVLGSWFSVLRSFLVRSLRRERRTKTTNQELRTENRERRPVQSVSLQHIQRRVNLQHFPAHRISRAGVLAGLTVAKQDAERRGEGAK